MRRRVLATHLRGWIDPAVAFSALAGAQPAAFWLDSGIGAAAGWSYIGSSERVVTATIDENSVTEQPSGRRREGSILDFLREELDGGIEPEPAAGPFQLGWVGWLGYELHAQTMSTGLRRASGHPDAALMFVDRAIAFDHAARRVTLIAIGDEWTADLQSWRASVEHALSRRLPLSSPLVHGSGRSAPAHSDEDRAQKAESGAPEVEWAYTDAEYLSMIGSCQKAIAEGDAYQLCLTTEARVTAHPDPVDSYLALRALSPTRNGGFVRIGEVSLLSSSPEQFLTVAPDGLLESKPIKGTRRRGASTEEDAALRRELVESEKERAENLMIVDLMRNDLGRVSEVGSVGVVDLLTVESYAQVHQLVSTVQGRLAGELGPVDAVAACFPAGSMTGAPKHSAVLILDGLERRARGIYSGAFGYFGLDGRIDLAMVIRSIVLDTQGATIGTGGGITALSVPEEELDEVKLKAAALLSVLGAVIW